MDFYTYCRRLPHWRLRGATYFVTWRTHTSQAPLSAAERDLVFSAVRHFEGARYTLGAHVVMDDHVHVVVTPHEPHGLTAILHSWKSFSANALRRQHGRSGRVWLAEAFDRILRDDRELEEVSHYILTNPRKRWPALAEYRWVAPNGLVDPDGPGGPPPEDNGGEDRMEAQVGCTKRSG